jgi:hypothetical protein
MQGCGRLLTDSLTRERLRSLDPSVVGAFVACVGDVHSNREARAHMLGQRCALSVAHSNLGGSKFRLSI